MTDLVTVVAGVWACLVVWYAGRVGVFAVRHRAALRAIWAQQRDRPEHPIARFAIFMIVVVIVALWDGTVGPPEDSAFSSVEP